VVVVVDGNQVSQLQMTCQRSCFASYTFHRASISKEGVGVVRDQIVAWLVKQASRVCLSNSETNSIREPLSQGTRRHLNAWCLMRLWMARGYAVDLAEVLEVVHANLVAEEVEESILQHAPVSIEQDEAIPIDLVWILRIEGHKLIEENVGDWRHPHGRARMARVRLERGIDLAVISSAIGLVIPPQCAFSALLSEALPPRFGELVQMSYVPREF
jgi:hypothetical protein